LTPPISFSIFHALLQYWIQDIIVTVPLANEMPRAGGQDMKTSRFAVAVLALGAVALFMAACTNPLLSSQGGSNGSLSIRIVDSINARTLLPPIDMNAASYELSGTGPGGATFSQSAAGGTVTVGNLAFGSWSVTVDALNAGGTIIGSGQATAAVQIGHATTLSITVAPLAGNGTLSLTVSWPGAQVDAPSIEATLTPSAGPAITLSFSVTGSQATYSGTTMPAGYGTLQLQLFNHNIPVMGAVDVVRIVAGQTTSGTYAFTNVNQPGGPLQVNITPALADPIPVQVSGVGSTVTAGASITATASVTDSTTNVVYVWYLNGVSQATGSSYTFGSSLLAGYYRLDVTAYTADGARAGSATARFQVISSGSVVPYVYVTNYGGDSVSAYSVGSTGLLTPLSTPNVAAGNFPQAIAATPSGSFLYVTNVLDNTLSGYAIGAGGVLTPLSTPIFLTGAAPIGIAVTPNGSFLYVTNGTGNTVSAYAIGASGLLTRLSTPTFATGTTPFGIAVTPGGSFLYVTNQASNTLSAFSIGAGGLLTPLSTPTVATGAAPAGIAVTPNGSFLYVTNNTGNTVSAFSVGAGGLLTPLSTPTVASGTAPQGVTVTPNGSFLYVTNAGSSNVSGYSIGPAGLLTPLSTPTFATGSIPHGVAVTPDSSILYVTNYSTNTVSAYAIGAGGLLTPTSAPTFATGTSPWGIAVVP
jgi:6-phosphogluconolactonase